jgi:hypothetical protein
MFSYQSFLRDWLLEVNEELMDVMKEAMSKASLRIPEMMRRPSEEKK